MDKDHNHLVTGSLKIIDHNKLRRLLTKALKYRENRTDNYQKTKDSKIIRISKVTFSFLA